MERRLTIRDIARALGYHYSTVSLALRDDIRLPEKTRRAVQEAAQRMGYRPDPMVQALAFYRAATKPSADHGTLAWLTNERTPQVGRDYAFYRYVEAANFRAGQLGYRIEEFVLRAPGMTPRRMVQILLARGITGLLVAPQPMGRIRARIRMDWAPFSAVTIGYSLAWPLLHLVANHQFNTAKQAYRKLTSFGYRRIGLAFDNAVNGRSNGGFVGGYLSESARWPEEMRIPPFLYERWNAPSIRKWFRTHKPEALIVHDSDILELAIADLKIKVPGQIGIVCLSETSKGYATIDQNSHEIGIAAVDLLVSMMHRNERGIPKIPGRFLIEGTWKEGTTVRRVNLDRAEVPKKG